MEVWKEIQVYLTALFLDCAVVPAPIKKRAAEAHRQRQGDGKMMGVGVQLESRSKLQYSVAQ